MGMRSYFENEDIEVTDAKGLTKFLIKFKELDIKGYFDYMYNSFLDNLIDGKPYSFESWNDIKLISYWYPKQLSFLNLINKYIEGDVSWNFESVEECANITFEEGKTIIEIGNMNYTQHTPSELRGNEVKETEEDFLKLIEGQN